GIVAGRRRWRRGGVGFGAPAVARCDVVAHAYRLLALRGDGHDRVAGGRGEPRPGRGASGSVHGCARLGQIRPPPSDLSKSHFTPRISSGRVVAPTRTVMFECPSVTAVFQPVVRLRDDAVVGYEALARMATPPDHPPDQWLALAARAGRRADLERVCLTAATAHGV